MPLNSQISNSTGQDQVKQAIVAFEQSTLSGVWQHLDKQVILNEMRSRVSDPFKVNQGRQPFCGPASVLFELIRKQPLRYIQICQSLFETGSFQAKTKSIQTSERLRRESRGNLQMGQADWMVLATLRESENLIFPVDPDAPEIVRNLSGMTKSWEMKGWVEEVLGYQKVKYIHTYVIRDLAAMREAAEVVAVGGVAFALVTAEGLLNNKVLSIVVPNHWITLLGNISIRRGTFGKHDSGHVSCDVYTWARKMHVDMDEGPFENYLWGIVLGQP